MPTADPRPRVTYFPGSQEAAHRKEYLGWGCAPPSVLPPPPRSPFSALLPQGAASWPGTWACESQGGRCQPPAGFPCLPHSRTPATTPTAPPPRRDLGGLIPGLVAGPSDPGFFLPEFTRSLFIPDLSTNTLTHIHANTRGSQN